MLWVVYIIWVRYNYYLILEVKIFGFDIFIEIKRFFFNVIIDVVFMKDFFFEINMFVKERVVMGRCGDMWYYWYKGIYYVSGIIIRVVGVFFFKFMRFFGCLVIMFIRYID